MRCRNLVALTVCVALLGSVTACTRSPEGMSPASRDNDETAVISLYRDGAWARTADHSETDPLASLHTGSTVHAGVSITTDASGLAAVAFPGGSTLRVGPDSQLDLTAVSAEEVVETLAHGRSWHRVVGAVPTYRVTADVGGVAVDFAGIDSGAADTQFSLECNPDAGCDLAVLAGTVTVAIGTRAPLTVSAYQQLALRAGTVADDNAARPTILPVDAIFGVSWFATNLALDDDGNPPVGTSVGTGVAGSAAAAASIAGSWSIDTVVVGSDDPDLPSGTVSHRDWTFDTAVCGETCEMVLTRSFGAVGQPASETVDERLTYSADGFHAHREYLSDCVSADGTVFATDYFAQTNDYELHVTAVEIRNGVPTATRLEGTATSLTRFASDNYVNGCYLDAVAPTRQSVVGVLVTPASRTPLAAALIPLPPVAPADAADGDYGLGPTPAAETPSVFSELTTAQALDATPLRIAASLGFALILLLIVGYPAHLLSSTIYTNYARIFWWTAPLERRLTSVSLRVKRPPRWLPLAFGIVLGSLIAAFVDPGFGVNAASVRVLASVALAFVVHNLFSWMIAGAAARRMDGASAPIVRFRYGSLVIVLAAVLFSRLTGFEPGMVVGMIVGLKLAVTLAKAHTARLTLIGIGYSAMVSIASWIAFSILVPVFGEEPGVVGVFILETLSAFAISGFAALPIALLPMAVLDGGKLFAWNRRVWATAYVAGVTVFLVILLPLPSSWGMVQTPLVTWLCVYIGFSAFAMAVWAYFRFRVPKPTKQGASPA